MKNYWKLHELADKKWQGGTPFCCGLNCGSDSIKKYPSSFPQKGLDGDTFADRVRRDRKRIKRCEWRNQQKNTHLEFRRNKAVNQ